MTLNNQMNHFIEEQFSLLPKLLESQIKLPVDQVIHGESLVFVGSGSSLNAIAMAEAYLKEYTDKKILTITPAAYLEGIENFEDHILVAVSQTGTSLATLDCLRKAKSAGHLTIFISAVENSEKRTLADIFIDLYCSNELIGPKTVGYSATFLRLIQLGLTIGTHLGKVDEEKHAQVVEQLFSAIGCMPRVKENIENWLVKNDHWSDLNYVTVAAEGRFKALIDEGALKLLETLRVPAMSYEIGEFTHGPHRLIKDNSHHIFIGTGGATELTSRVTNYAKYFTENTLYLSVNNSDIDLVLKEETLGIEILFTLVFQVLANEWAMQTGFNPDCKVHENFFKFVGTKD